MRAPVVVAAMPTSSTQRKGLRSPATSLTQYWRVAPASFVCVVETTVAPAESLPG